MEPLQCQGHLKIYNIGVGCECVILTEYDISVKAGASTNTTKVPIGEGATI